MIEAGLPVLRVIALGGSVVLFGVGALQLIRGLLIVAGSYRPDTGDPLRERPARARLRGASICQVSIIWFVCALIAFLFVWFGRTP